MARDGSLGLLNRNRNFYLQLFTSVSTTFKTCLHRLVGENEEGEVSFNTSFFVLRERAEGVRENSDPSLLG